MKYTPLKMQPVFKDYLWGGERLKKEFGKQSDLPVVAESWELACHVDGKSLIEDGRSLEDLTALDKGGFWGTDCQAEDFPILVKLIDAKQDLSIQVHPSDWTAIGPLGEQGKAEMWYIVEAEAHSFIYYGFSQTVSAAEFRHRAEDGTICEVLNKVPVHKGDVFYILPGTIHAIGAGLVIAEIQQSSNTSPGSAPSTAIGPVTTWGPSAKKSCWLSEAAICLASSSTISALMPYWPKYLTGSRPWSSSRPSWETVSKVTALPEGTVRMAGVSRLGKQPH